MVEVRPETKYPPIDVCRHCALLWLDPHELEQLPPAGPGETAPALVAEAPVAKVEKAPAVGLLAEAEQFDDPDRGGPFAVEDEWPPFWQWGGLLLGMPMESAAPKQHQQPWATWTVAALITVVSILAFLDKDWAWGHFTLIPSDPLRYGGVTLISSFFLHADWWHLIGNLYFLLLFGAHVEDYLGRRNFLLLLLLATLGGEFLQIALDPQRSVPNLGASGGISGLMAFYALRFPRAKLILLFGRLIPFRLSVWIYFAVWAVVQGIGVIIQLQGHSGVAYLAHVGGILVGGLFWLQDDSWKWRKGRGRLILRRKSVAAPG
jgi:membrane associated rhomboid family serine protease